jgi:predicted nucleic acid-binding protein
MIVISDTSVVSALIHIDQLSLLQRSYGTILIPRAVHRELIRTHSELPAFVEVREVKDRAKVEKLKLFWTSEKQKQLCSRKKAALTCF